MTTDDFHAYLVITDISGYTGLIKANAHAVKHAQYVVSELMAAILGAARPPLTPAKLEGDAVFFAGRAEDGAGPMVGQSLLAFFQAFTRRRDEMVAANTCPCQACTTIGQLELKVVAHHGQVHSYALGGFSELAGYDIIVAHRLLKNRVAGKRYALVTESVWPLLALPEAEAKPHAEHYDDVGEVRLRLIRPPGGEAPPRAGLVAKVAEFVRKGWKSTLSIRSIPQSDQFSVDSMTENH